MNCPRTATRSVALISIVAALLLVIGLVPVKAFAQPASGQDGSGDTAQPSGQVVKVADPDTSGTWKELFDRPDGSGFSYSTEEAGRIWVDKSVFASTSDAEAAGVPNASLDDADLDFLVSLSAVSSTSTVRTEQTKPHDVVFVVTLNATFASYHYDGKAYGEHLADALNEAIARLMADNSDGMGPDAETRVAVVGYTIDSTVLMPLDTYQPDANGRYVEFTHPAGSDASLNVVASPDSPGTSVSNASFRGHAYLQRALATAGDLLVEAGKASSDDEPRAPELVVLGTEVPVTANTDIADPPAYKGEAQGENGFLGTMPTGHNVGYGTDAALATLLTLQNVSALVGEAYRTPDQDMGVYTVGLDAQGLGGYVLQTARGQAEDVVDGTGAAAGTNLCENIAAARQAYGQAADAGDTSVTIQLYSAGSGDLKKRDVEFPNPVAGLLAADDGYAFRGATNYIPATDAGALPDSFDAAVDHILDIEYSSSVNYSPTDNPDSSDRLHMEDDLGCAMTVKRIDGIEFEGSLLDGSLAAAAVATSFTDPWDIEAYHELQYLMYALNKRYNLGWDAYNLLYEAYANGQIAYRGEDSYSNYAAWYVDAGHNMVSGDRSAYRFASQSELDAVESGNWQNAGDAERSAIEKARAAGAVATCQTYFYIGNLANQYTGADVPLYDFVVMVETSLEDGSQKVLFSAPAESIPALKAYVTQRTDGTAVMELDGDVAETEPIRLVYEVGPRQNAADVIRKIAAGEEVSEDEAHAAFGANVKVDSSGTYFLYESSFGNEDGTIVPDAGMSALTAPENSYYSFVKDTPLFQLKPGVTLGEGERPNEDQVEPLKTQPASGQVYCYRETHFQADGLTAGNAVTAQEVTTFAPYTIAVDGTDISRYFAADGGGQYCALAHTPKFSVSALLEDYAKNPNATASASYSKQLSVGEYRELAQTLLRAKLGNNGTLAVKPAAKTGSLAVSSELVASGTCAQITDKERTTALPFKATLRDGNDAPLSGPVEMTLPDGTTELAELDGEGCVSFELADGQTVLFPSLPEGTSVRIEEQLNMAGFSPSWKVSVNGTQQSEGQGTTADVTIAADAKTDVAFSNAKEAGTLSIGKHVSGNAADPVQQFTFDVKLFQGKGGPALEGPVSYAIGTAEGETTLTGTADVGEDGTVTLEGGASIKLSSDQGIIFGNLPVGTTYTVSESDAEALGYTASATCQTNDGSAEAFDGKGAINAADQRDVLQFENEKYAYGSLRVEKILGGTAANESSEFSFTATLTDASGSPSSGTVDVTIAAADGTTTSNEMTLDDKGSFTFKLKGGESMTAEGILQGTSYRVEEEDLSNEGYIVKRSNAEGTIGSDPAVASFVNVKQEGSLGIAKIVGGNAGDRSASYTFTVTVEGMFADSTGDTDNASVESNESSAGDVGASEGGKNSKAESAKEYKATRYTADGTTESETVSFAPADGGSGVATVKLAHDEGILIGGLSHNASFSVAEDGAEDLIENGYTIYAGAGKDLKKTEDGSYSGKLVPDNAVGVYFVNEKNAFGNLSIEKKVSGNAAETDAADGRLYSFAITAEDAQGTPLSGTYDATLEGSTSDEDASSSQKVTFDNGTATVLLPAPATLVVKGIPAGSSYAVVEQSLALEGYETTVEGDQGTIPENGTAYASFSNVKSYKTASIAISGTETLFGRSQASGEFEFCLYEEDGTTPVLDADGAPIRVSNPAASAGSVAPFSFPVVSVDKPGTYTYVVRQQVPEGADPAPGVSYDDRSFTVSFEVTAQPTGTLVAGTPSYTVDGESVAGVSFVNQYRTSSGSFSLSAAKTLEGASLETGAFAFSLQEVDPQTEDPIGTPIVVRNNEQGLADFGTFAAQAPLGGSVTRTFIATELLPSSANADNGYVAGGVTYDPRRFRIDVTGSDPDATGSLQFATSVQVSSPAEDGSWSAWSKADADDLSGQGMPLFRNAYDDEAAVVDGPAVAKTLAGREWEPADSFSFAIAPVKATASDGKPLADGAPLPPSATISISSFDAAAQGKDSSGEAVDATFGRMAFTEAGTYVYAIYENPGDSATQPGIDYSSALWFYTVDVTSDGQGHLNVSAALHAALDDEGKPLGSASSDADTAQFTNRSEEGAFASFDGAVEYIDESGTHPLGSGMFRFRIEAAGDNADKAPMPALQEAANEGSLFTFGSATFPYDESLAGQSFTYHVSQVIPDGAVYSEDGTTATLDGIVYDARTLTVTVRLAVEMQPDGGKALVAIVDHPENDGQAENRVVFHNVRLAEEDPDNPGGGTDEPGGNPEEPGGDTDNPDEPGGDTGEPDNPDNPDGDPDNPGGGTDEPGSDGQGETDNPGGGSQGDNSGTSQPSGSDEQSGNASEEEPLVATGDATPNAAAAAIAMAMAAAAVAVIALWRTRYGRRPRK